MKSLNFTYRAREEEVMDNFYLKGNELEKTLRDLDKVNKWLGGNKITLDGIKEILKRTQSTGTIEIMDVGCGNGNLLREIADFARREDLQFKLIGVDANEFAINIAKNLSSDYSEISFLHLNIFSDAFKDLKADIILCTLTLHHFEDQEIERLMTLFLKNSQLGIVINDLHRSGLAYRLFQLFCLVFIDNEIARKDGLISIRRGFKRKDLEKYAANLAVPQRINWKWAFRFQWLLFKNQNFIG